MARITLDVVYNASGYVPSYQRTFEVEHIRNIFDAGFLSATSEATNTYDAGKITYQVDSTDAVEVFYTTQLTAAIEALITAASGGGGGGTVIDSETFVVRYRANSPSVGVTAGDFISQIRFYNANTQTLLAPIWFNESTNANIAAPPFGNLNIVKPFSPNTNERTLYYKAIATTIDYTIGDILEFYEVSQWENDGGNGAVVGGSWNNYTTGATGIGTPPITDIVPLGDTVNVNLTKGQIEELSFAIKTQDYPDTPAVGFTSKFIGYSSQKFTDGSYNKTAAQWSIERIVTEDATDEVTSSFANANRFNYNLIFDSGSQEFLNTYTY